MTSNQERTLRACQEICRLLADNAIERIELDLKTPSAFSLAHVGYLRRTLGEFQKAAATLDEVGNYV